MRINKKCQEIKSLKTTINEFWKASAKLQRKVCGFPVHPHVALKWFDSFKSVRNPEGVVMRMNHLASQDLQKINVFEEMNHIFRECNEASPSFSDMDTLKIQFKTINR